MEFADVSGPGSALEGSTVVANTFQSAGSRPGLTPTSLPHTVGAAPPPAAGSVEPSQAKELFQHYTESRPSRASEPAAGPTVAAGPGGSGSVGTMAAGLQSMAACSWDGGSTAEGSASHEASWQAAAAGVRGSGGALPHLAVLQAAFGSEFDLSLVQAHQDAAAVDATDALQAKAVAIGEHVVFGGAPDLFLAAHEAAHVIQQRNGVQLTGGRGEAGDVYESHADAVAERVVRGEDVAGLLRQTPTGGGGASQAIQCKDDPAKKGKKSGPPASEAQRRSARQELLAWQSSSQKFINNNRIWLSSNWIDFIGKTSPNIRLAWSDRQTAAIVGTIVGNFANEISMHFLKKGATALLTLIGTEIAPGVGTAIGFVVGVLIDTASSAIYEAITGKSDLDEARADSSQETASQIQAKMGGFETQAEKSFDKLAQLTSQCMTDIDAPETAAADIAKLIDFLQKERKAMVAPPAGDRSLFRRMLHDWVLEHAGDEEDANTHTSETQWERARTAVFGEGDSLDNHPEIFAYQTRAHWAEMGFEQGAPHAEAMIQEVNRQKNAEDRAGAIKAFYDGKTYGFTRTGQPDSVIKMINDSRYDTTPRGRKLIHENRFRIDCTLDLTTADGACYVDSWDYNVNLLGPVEPGMLTQGSFSVEPD